MIEIEEKSEEKIIWLHKRRLADLLCGNQGDRSHPQESIAARFFRHTGFNTMSVAEPNPRSVVHRS
jgi:hypothetical protein